MTELLYLSHTQLKIHPRNVRIYYPPADVAEMARSLLATGRTQPAGNIQALLIVSIEDEPDCYYVVDGNLRLSAARELALAGECPPLKCEVIEAGQAEQLLLMMTTGLHYPKDPISEGRHFRRLITEEGYTIKAIAAETGWSTATIGSRLACLDLDEEIQQMIMMRSLPADVRVVRALFAIPDQERRVEVARYYADRDVAIGTMIGRIRSLASRAHQLNGSGPTYEAGLAAARAKTKAASQAKRTNPHGLDEESARTVWRLAGEFLCEGCKLSDLSPKCYMCPGPQEFIEHLVELAEARLPEAEAQPQEVTQ